MKMGPSLFWGLLLVVLGLSLIIRIVFNVDFPIFKIFIAFVFIYFGIKILFGSFGTKVHFFKEGEKDIFFGEKNFSNFEGDGEYNTIFGKGSYDFRGFDLHGEKKHVKVSTVFGGSVIKLDRDMPVRIRVESAFAGADLPNGNSAVFGTTTYESPSFDQDKPYLDLKLDVVFGGIEVKTY